MEVAHRNLPQSAPTPQEEYTMATTESTNNYAPNWLPLFDDAGNMADTMALQVDCGLCHRMLAIQRAANQCTNTADNTASGSAIRDDIEAECFTVLPCGHAFGYNCLSNWFRVSDYPACPTCRKTMWHRGCGHCYSLTQIVAGDGLNVRSVVPRILVANQELPPQCSRCR
ncbi:hypothetical protein GGR56DRAFT_415414 [Xylariaceae sp. FL0804]|nr:hypothetical protein GGR56DRAFT_415414 [Xylariaceae sp. FL0804]